jgi:hypothetical protein
MIAPHVYQVLRRRYGEDVTHAAVVLTLQQRPPSPERRCRFLARRLALAGYHDGQLSQAHQHTRARERVMAGFSWIRHALWQSPAYDPARLAQAREALARLPAWLLEMAANDEAMERQHCAHAPRWWYRYPSSHGAAIRCRRCTAARTAQRRERVVS